jgi:hypothetical protein
MPDARTYDAAYDEPGQAVNDDFCIEAGFLRRLVAQDSSGNNACHDEHTVKTQCERSNINAFNHNAYP